MLLSYLALTFHPPPASLLPLSPLAPNVGVAGVSFSSPYFTPALFLSNGIKHTSVSSVACARETELSHPGPLS